jgi:ornithine carbamoyltransferase
MAVASGGDVRVVHDPTAGVAGAQVLYTDVWVSMGEESSRQERLALLRPFQVNRTLVAATGRPPEDLLFLHCLPAFHDDQTQTTRECGALEVTDEVFEAPYSRVFDQAENRMHTMKALFVATLPPPPGGRDEGG